MNGIEDALIKDRIYICETVGDSMEPMLKAGRDRVVIVPPVFPLKKYDVPVYRRDGHYTMHRIVKIRKNGYVICGDNRVNLERDITDKDIVGILAGFCRDGIYVDCTDEEYLRYAKKVCRNLSWRIIKKIIVKIFNNIKFKNKG